MIETYKEERWNIFENSGRVSDYLYYKGIGVKSLPSSKGASQNADNNRGSGDISP